MPTVRILRASTVEGEEYKPNELVDIPAKLAAMLVKDGAADDSDAAIKYCKDVGVETKKHEVSTKAKPKDKPKDKPEDKPEASEASKPDEK